MLPCYVYGHQGSLFGASLVGNLILIEDLSPRSLFELITVYECLRHTRTSFCAGY